MAANAERVERLYAAGTSADGLAYYDDSVEWDMSNYAGWADRPAYRGKEGVEEFMRGWLSSFDRWEATVEQIEERDDTVVAVIHDRAFLKGSSVPMTRRYAHLFRFSDDLIVYAAIYSDVDAALTSVTA